MIQIPKILFYGILTVIFSLFLLLSFVDSILIDESSYRQGQIDCSNMKMKYELIENTNGEVVWEKIKDPVNKK